MKSRTWMILAGGTAVVGLALGAASPASAGYTYTWINKPVLSNHTYKEPAESRSFSRDGVKSYLAAAGYYWDTELTFGSYTVHGYATASVNGPRSNLGTKVFWKYLNNPSDKTKVNLRVTLQDVSDAAGGMRRSEDAAPSALRLSEQGDGGVEPASLQPLGTQGTVSYWSGRDAAGQITLMAVDGKYAASTSVNDKQFAASGVTLRVDGPDGASEGVLLPSTPASDAPLRARGYEALTSSFYSSSAPAAKDLTVPVPVDGSVARSAGAAQRNAAQPSVRVRIFGASH